MYTKRANYLKQFIPILALFAATISSGGSCIGVSTKNGRENKAVDSPENKESKVIDSLESKESKAVDSLESKENKAVDSPENCATKSGHGANLGKVTRRQEPLEPGPVLNQSVANGGVNVNTPRGSLKERLLSDLPNLVRLRPEEEHKMRACIEQFDSWPSFARELALQNFDSHGSIFVLDWLRHVACELRERVDFGKMAKVRLLKVLNGTSSFNSDSGSLVSLTQEEKNFISLCITKDFRSIYQSGSLPESWPEFVVFALSPFSLGYEFRIIQVLRECYKEIQEAKDAQGNVLHDQNDQGVEGAEEDKQDEGDQGVEGAEEDKQDEGDQGVEGAEEDKQDEGDQGVEEAEDNQAPVDQTIHIHSLDPESD